MWLEVPSASGDDDHEVIITDPDEYREWVCDCEGYKFRSYCSHQEIAYQAFCNWITGEEPEQGPVKQQEKMCPRCGGPTERVWRRDRA